MKNKILAVTFTMLTAWAFAQKKEIKKAEKAIKAGDFQEALSQLQAAEGLIANADKAIKAQYYTVLGEIYLAEAGELNFDKMKLAVEALTQAKSFEDEKLAQRIADDFINLRVALVNSAIADQNKKAFNTAAEKLYTSYTISKKDTADLYYAAGNAINGKDYPKAISYYQTLLDLGFTGIRKEFTLRNVETEEIEAFASKTEQNANMLSGLYDTPSERNTKSLRGDILSNMALLLIADGQDEKALEIMAQAREENPSDISLVRAEADIMYKMGNMTRYNELMQQVIESDPSNPELYYNLGVGMSQNGDVEAAKKYYQQAIDLNPNYANAKINMAALILKEEGVIVEEMNNLGTSRADYDRYDELKEKKRQLYLEALPFLESAVDQRSENVELIRTLMNIYSQVGEDAKFKAMKEKLKELEGGF